MKPILAFVLLTLSLSLKSQLNKANWLVGGSAKFSTQKEILNSTAAKGDFIRISPSIGYFFIDKLAAGAKLGLSFDRIAYNGVVSKSSQLAYGPFVRYYFLPIENRVNLLGEVSYQHFTNSNNATNIKDQINAFTVSAGTAIFLNASVAIEGLINYELLNSKLTDRSDKTLYLSIGFQIHLEKDKD